jgi:hypothetical protein
MRRIETLDGATLVGFGEEVIEPGSTVVTDGSSPANGRCAGGRPA